MMHRLKIAVVAASLLTGAAWAQEEDVDAKVYAPGDDESLYQDTEQQEEIAAPEELEPAEEFGTTEELQGPQEPEMGIGQTEPMDAPMAEPQQDPFAQPEPIVVAEPVEFEEQDTGPDLTGVTVMVGGGVEGYTGEFAPLIDPGGAWGATATIKPWRALGLELGYSGAVNEVDSRVANDLQGASQGVDILRNGGHAAIVASIPTPVQPYVMGGFGLDNYQFRGVEGDMGFQDDDLVPNIPLGAGLRTHVGDFTADLRVNYDLLINDEFSPVDDNDVDFSNGRYAGLLQVGATF